MTSESETGLAPRPHPGGERRLSDKQHRQLERLLCQGAKARGWSNDLWTASRVKEVVERHFGVSYHRDHVRRILVDRLGWSVQKPAPSIGFSREKLAPMRAEAGPGAEFVAECQIEGLRYRKRFILDASLDLARRVVGKGLSHVGSVGGGDGVSTSTDAAGRSSRKSVAIRGHPGYLYFDVDDAFLGHGAVEVTVDFLDEGADWIELHYDSDDAELPHAGAYKSVGRLRIQDSGEWRRHTFELPDANFRSRKNVNADFRLHGSGFRSDPRGACRGRERNREAALNGPLYSSSTPGATPPVRRSDR